jgi:uncharacterized protein (DUF169 family)
MTPYGRIEQQLTTTLRLNRRPIAIAFRETAPEGVPKFDGSMPSSCSFWRLAADGQTFYTVASDHYNCAVGSYTHNIPLPAERAQELEQTLGLMTQIGYLRMEEVPGIPRLPKTPGVIVYAPLGDTPVDPDAVILSGRPTALMLVQEASFSAGLSAPAPLLGRPTCMAIPLAMTNTVAASLGCVGNRVYTDVPDDEFYVTVAGRDIERIAAQLDTITTANQTLRDYHQTRRATLATT